MARLPMRLPSLDAEPKGAAPPAYRTLTNTASSDSWSVGSQQDKRKSWTGLVDSNENLNKYRVNHYPKVHHLQPEPVMMQRHTFFGSACQLGQVSTAPLARQTGGSSMSNMSDIITFSMPKAGAYPLHADPVFIPASGGGSYPPSESMAPAPGVAPDPRPEVPAPPKRNRLQEWKNWCCRPRMTMIFFVLLLLLIIGAIIAIVVTQALAIPTTLSMMWQAPDRYRGGQVAANRIDMNAETPDRIRFQLKGAAPFKNSFVAYYDFKTGKSVIIDDSLKKNGEQFACFALPIDTANTPNFSEMLAAAARAKARIGQTEGWDEAWTVAPSPMDNAGAKAQFNPPIPECDKARWIQLQKTAADQRSQKCAECHEFCLPEFGIQGQPAEGYLNIVRRNCFGLFVPEWRSYTQGNTAEQNQRDFEAFYRNRQSQAGDASGSKWIPLAGMRPAQPYGPSSPAAIPAPGMPMQLQPQQNGYGLPMQPYGVGQQQLQQQQPGSAASFQPYGVLQNGQQPQQQQVMQSPQNGMGPSGNGNSLFQNGVAGLPQQVVNAGQGAVSAIGSAASDLGQGVSNLYSNLQQTGAQAVDQFGNALSNAQQSIAGVVSMPQGGTGSSAYGQRAFGYGSGGVSSNGGTIDWQGSTAQQPGQTAYPGGFLPNGLQSTALEAGIPGVSNPQYYQPGQQQRMGDLTGYAPNVVAMSNGGLQQVGANEPRQMAGVIGMMAPAAGAQPTPPPSSGYVPDVAMPAPQTQQQQQMLPANQFYGRGRR